MHGPLMAMYNNIFWYIQINLHHTKGRAHEMRPMFFPTPDSDLLCKKVGLEQSQFEHLIIIVKVFTHLHPWISFFPFCTPIIPFPNTICNASCSASVCHHLKSSKNTRSVLQKPFCLPQHLCISIDWAYSLHFSQLALLPNHVASSTCHSLFVWSL